MTSSRAMKKMDMHSKCHSERSEESSFLSEQPPYQEEVQEGKLQNKLDLLYNVATLTIGFSTAWPRRVVALETKL